jgi:hypothetical protein
MESSVWMDALARDLGPLYGNRLVLGNHDTWQEQCSEADRPRGATPLLSTCALRIATKLTMTQTQTNEKLHAACDECRQYCARQPPQ